jgi:hypothetical protein
MALSLKELKEKYLGKKVEYHSYGATAFNQCVDLVNAYINECLDNNTKDYTEIIGTDAKDFKDKFDPEDFDFIANTKTPNVAPERGDIPIWNGRVGGGAGHVAIVLEATGLKFISLDQNWSEVEKVTVEEHDYNNVSGWLRPKHVLLEDPEESLDENIKLTQQLFDLNKKLDDERDEHILIVLAKDKMIKDYGKQASELTVQLISARQWGIDIPLELKSIREGIGGFKDLLALNQKENDEKMEYFRETTIDLRDLVSKRDRTITDLKKESQKELNEVGWFKFIWAKIRR